MLDGMAAKDCICFPVDEPPDLESKAEIEAAKAIRCPFHGGRFSSLAPYVYRAPNSIRPVHLQVEDYVAWHSPQYLKALKASFTPDRWPASEVTEPNGTVRFVLKDGVEIHQVGPPPEVYDYDTGKLIGRVGPEDASCPDRSDW